jgi:hypothetical protein
VRVSRGRGSRDLVGVLVALVELVVILVADVVHLLLDMIRPWAARLVR